MILNILQRTSCALYLSFRVLKVNGVWEPISAMACHLPYGITQFYLLADTNECTPTLTTARRAGTGFTYIRQIET